MTVQEFIKKYNKAKDKAEYLSARIKRMYVPVIEKANIAERLVRAASYTDGVYRRRSFISTMLHELAFVSLYTDIEIQFDKNFNEDYDALEELGLIGKIKTLIGRTETERFDMLYWDTEADLEYNETEIHSYVRQQVDRLINVITTIGQPVADELVKSGKLEELLTAKE